MPTQSHYHEIIKNAVFDGQEQAGSPGYVTAMTKAHFKDGAIDHAIKFFDE